MFRSTVFVGGVVGSWEKLVAQELMDSLSCPSGLHGVSLQCFTVVVRSALSCSAVLRAEAEGDGWGANHFWLWPDQWWHRPCIIPCLYASPRWALRHSFFSSENHDLVDRVAAALPCHFFLGGTTLESLFGRVSALSPRGDSLTVESSLDP